MQTRDLIVRKAEQRDAEALAGVFRESWELAYRGIIPHKHLDLMVRQRNARWWHRSIGTGSSTLVLELAGEIGGYVNFGRSRWSLPQEGEIYELYMAPPYQGVGLGEHLFEGARFALDTRKLSGLLVWALTDNDSACAFYRRRGGRPVAKAFERMSGQLVPKLAFAWS